MTSINLFALLVLSPWINALGYQVSAAPESAIAAVSDKNLTWQATKPVAQSEKIRQKYGDHGIGNILLNSDRAVIESRLRKIHGHVDAMGLRIESLKGNARDQFSIRASSLGRPGSFVGNGREIIYGLLHVSDARDETIEATMRVIEADMIQVEVHDCNAVCPLCVDPTFSDADWVVVNAGIPGAGGGTNGMVLDPSGNLHVGGNFDVIGHTFAKNIAKWDGASCSALGSGMTGSNFLNMRSIVYALALDRFDNLHAGGNFYTAGGKFTPCLAEAILNTGDENK